ncbi:MAG: hypothetical protein IID16_07525, partial [Candidatus Marinimicrobia bacterium]|nr:hypothetical protein [Candidatus Neomarinimicrobiota bacterium]
MSLANRIRERLRVTDQTANAASSLGGLNRDYIGDLLNEFDNPKKADPNPRLDSLIKLAKGLRCQLSDLTGENDPSPVDEAEILSNYRILDAD